MNFKSIYNEFDYKAAPALELLVSTRQARRRSCSRHLTGGSRHQHRSFAHIGEEGSHIYGEINAFRAR